MGDSAPGPPGRPGRRPAHISLYVEGARVPAGHAGLPGWGAVAHGGMTC
jgi:hypothetical protein